MVGLLTMGYRCICWCFMVMIYGITILFTHYHLIAISSEFKIEKLSQLNLPGTKVNPDCFELT